MPLCSCIKWALLLLFIIPLQMLPVLSSCSSSVVLFVTLVMYVLARIQEMSTFTRVYLTSEVKLVAAGITNMFAEAPKLPN